MAPLPAHGHRQRPAADSEVRSTRTPPASSGRLLQEYACRPTSFDATILGRAVTSGGAAAASHRRHARRSAGGCRLSCS